MDEQAGGRADDDRARIERAWREHRTRQILRGLELTPRERLRWLEDNLVEMRAWLGRASSGDSTGAPRRSSGA